MSDTPRTDAELFLVDQESEIDPGTTHSDEVVSADFARQLERELNEARQEAERWRDCFKTGMSRQIKSPSNIFSWEREKQQVKP